MDDDEIEEPIRMLNPQALRDGEIEVLPAKKSPVEIEEQRALATSIEEDAVTSMRSNAQRAAEIQSALLERALTVDDKDLGSTLRAVSDVQAKSVDGLLKLTGRAPEQADGGPAQILRSLAAAGLVRLNVELEVGQAPAAPNGPEK